MVYALSASAAAAQAVMVGMEPGNFESPVASALSDACVMVIGSLLWRVELQQRADSLRVIWEKAKEREESLTRAEAGLGDTIWTARVRAQKNKSAASTTSSNALDVRRGRVFLSFMCDACVDFIQMQMQYLIPTL